jgi:niacin transporter
MKDVKKLTYAALLTAWAILIPIYFKGLQVQIPPFTATITAHVPIFLGILFGPQAAVMVGLGSALGFLMSSGPIIASRALMHAIIGFMGATLLKKGMSYNKVLLIIAPIHAALEALVVIPFGYTAYKVLVVVGIGTLLHHTVDALISGVLVRALSKATRKDLVKEAV